MTTTKKQHTSPCKKCPFRRTAPNGWLGGTQTPEQFSAMAQKDVRMPCHSHMPGGLSYADAQTPGTPEHEAPQCAGRAIHWANQIKTPRDPSLLVLPKDTKTVFQWPHEFIAHHKREV